MSSGKGVFKVTKTTQVIKIDNKDPDLSRIREIARAGREGKIVAFPTETVYGMGAPMSVPQLSDRLAELKKRPADKPFSYHIAGSDMIDFLTVKRTAELRYLSRLFWPGPLTLLVLTENQGKIGIRFPRHRLALALINAVGEPFLATSANLSGETSPTTAEEVLTRLNGQIDYVIDAGKTELGMDSTVVDLTQKEPALIRRGAESEAVQKALECIRDEKFPQKKILFVCTGNSCRSPMAAGWLIHELRRKGLHNKIEVASCGIGARSGSSATAEAQLVMKNREVDISAHRSKPCTREDVMESDLIFAMSTEHFVFITGMVPGIKEKVRVLNIPDPIGMGIMIYEEVLKNIEKKLTEQWSEIIS